VFMQCNIQNYDAIALISIFIWCVIRSGVNKLGLFFFQFNGPHFN
jgi:hypothetical protein